jgi:Ner family transcriptional regulator
LKRIPIDRIAESQRVKNLLELAGYRLSDIDRLHRLPRGSAGESLRQPHLAAERAIAKALGEPAERLWPSRYDASGRRLSPQPSANYDRPPTIRQRRIAQPNLAGAR